MSARWVAIVLAAGSGTRMQSDVPKVAHRIAGRPLVRHVIEAARAAGVAEVIAVVAPGEAGAAARAACGRDVRFAEQPRALGTGDAVACAREAAAGAECVLILNGDVPLVRGETLASLMAAAGSGDGAPLALLTAVVPLESYGFLELDGGRVTRIVETKDAGAIDRGEARYINAGQYAARASWLWPRLARIPEAANGERYLTALAAMAAEEGEAAVAVIAADADEVRGINDRVQLAEAEELARRRIRRAHMAAGVTLVDPATTYIDADVTIGRDCVVEPLTFLRGGTRIGEGCRIGPAADIRDSTLGGGCVVRQAVIEESVLEEGVDVGPFCHLRPGSHLCAGVHLGNYAEVKASRLGPRTKMGHFSYIGDADVGADVNIGAGTITANYDGARKHRTEIGDGAFIGTDTMLVAPLRIGRGARTAAGSVVTRDVPDGMMAIGAPARLRAQGGGSEEQDAGR